jgi:hypothetical protein
VTANVECKLRIVELRIAELDTRRLLRKRSNLIEGERRCSCYDGSLQDIGKFAA